MALNYVVMQGRLCKDPELRSTGGGKKVCTFTIAVDRGKEQGADFFSCVAWERLAEMVDKWFVKGDPILVSGRLQTRKFEDRDGKQRQVQEILVREVNFCGGKKAKALEELQQFPNVQFKETDEEGLPF